MLVGQAIARVVFAMGDSAPRLRSIGFVRRQLVAAMVLPMIVAAAIGAVVSVGRRGLPLVVVPGRARRSARSGSRHPLRRRRGAPRRGRGCAVLATLIALGAAFRVDEPDPARVRDGSRRGSRGAIRQVASPPIGIGAGLALERGRGDRSLPVRLAIIGGVVAVVGVIGSLGLAARASTTRCTTRPAPGRSGPRPPIPETPRR